MTVLRKRGGQRRFVTVQRSLYPKGLQTSMCLHCASPVEQRSTGRWRDYCSTACRQAAYRARRSVV